MKRYLFTSPSQVLTALADKSVQNISGKEENADKQHFLLFPQCFLVYLWQILSFDPQLICFVLSGVDSNSVNSKPFPKRQILDCSKMKAFLYDNFYFLINGRKLSKKGKKTLWEKEKLLGTSDFSLFNTVFKRLVLQARKNKGLFRKELKTPFSQRTILM